ncbi:MAG: GGDEF domain-containing protein, partial [Gammaproteobacteria bacterium]|nr:GGDEF domain-containing protein [Gammaproteobacteria bacterium]
VYPDDANTPELLLRNADTAMFKSKQMGRNMLQFYLPEFTKKAELRTQLENELDLAIKNDEILIYYQPQIDQNGCLIGVESLARWNHPVKGFIPPNIFIPMSEESGQIIPLSNLIIDKVLSFLSTLEKKGLPETFKTISINVSPKHFNQKDFCSGVNVNLKHYGVDASKVMIEITEGLILTNVDEVINKMERLKSMAIKFSIDDFGTGYSSLSYLQKLPLDEIKIDQSFIQEMLEDKGSAAIVEMIITMADKLGFTLMAEGVETIQHKEFLKSLGCFNYQGYYFDRPMSEEKFVEKYI